MKMWWATPTSALDCEGTDIGSYFWMIFGKMVELGGIFFWKSEIHAVGWF